MEVPTISLAPYLEVEAERCSSSAAGGEAGNIDFSDARLIELVASVRKACEEVGFFVVVDHGVGTDLMERQRRECTEFFDRPPQSTVVGMVAGASSRFAWLDFVPPTEDASCTAADDAGDWSLGPVAGRCSMPWRPDLASLRTVWAEYYAAMERLVAAIMRVFALALGLPAGAFDSALRGHRSSLRALLYPEVSASDLAAAGGEVVRSREHTDWGCITVLLPDAEVGGLELRTGDGAWSPLVCPAGGLVVNLGELLPFWTQGRWVATRHRVVARSGDTQRRRLSIPYFGLVNRETALVPLLPPAREQERVGGDEARGTTGCGIDSLVLTAGEFFEHHEVYAMRPAKCAERRMPPSSLGCA